MTEVTKFNDQKELVKIEDRGGIETVNARELHKFLEVGKDFSTWIRDRIVKYGFIEGKDFSPDLGKTSGDAGGRPLTEYYLSLDMAKEISMLENNDKGRQARRWFIERERQANSWAKDPIIVLRLNQIEMENDIRLIKHEIDMLKPETGFYTVTAYAKHTGQRVNDSQARHYGIVAASICRQRGIEAGKVPHPLYKNIGTYPEDILEEVMGNDNA